MLKEPPIWNFILCSAGYQTRRTTLKFEYLPEFEPKFENVLGYELGAIWGRFMKKTKGQKSRATVHLS